MTFPTRLIVSTFLLIEYPPPPPHTHLNPVLLLGSLSSHLPSFSPPGFPSSCYPPRSLTCLSPPPTIPPGDSQYSQPPPRPSFSPPVPLDTLLSRSVNFAFSSLIHLFRLAAQEWAGKNGLPGDRTEKGGPTVRRAPPTAANRTQPTPAMTPSSPPLPRHSPVMLPCPPSI